MYTTATTKKSCRGKMPYMISSQSVTDGVSLSVSKSKLVYSKKTSKVKNFLVVSMKFLLVWSTAV